MTTSIEKYNLSNEVSTPCETRCPEFMSEACKGIKSNEGVKKKRKQA